MVTHFRCLLLIVLCLTIVHTAEINNDLYIDDLDRNIDASNNNVVKQDLRVTLVNQGSSLAQTFHFALPKSFANDHLSQLVVKQDGKTLGASAGYSNSAQKDSLFYEVPLSTAIQPKQKITLVVEIALVNRIIVAHPSHIEQQENQKVLYSDNVYFYSPYKVRSQRTRVTVGTNQIESFTQDRASNNNQGTISYGPYGEQKPYADQQLKVHFVNNKPFVVVSSVERIIEVSHWGNLAIEEHYDLRHDGAKLKGPFSRYDYSKNPYQTSPSSFRELTAKLPLQASDIYFRDRIGNISSSNCRPSGKDLLVDFLPRFPLFGGWRIRFYIGWNLPIQHYLSNTGDQFRLKTGFSIPFDFATVDDMTIKVILPEGARNPKLHAPFRVDAEHLEELKTYLDVTGRPVLVIKKSKCSGHHAQDFTVTYDFTYSTIGGEPLMVIAALFAFCLFVMAYTRFNLTIRQSDVVKREEQLVRVQEIAESYISAQQQREGNYGRLEGALRSSSIDALDVSVTAIKSAREQIDRAIVDSFITPLKEHAASRALELVQQLEKKERDRFEAAIKLVQQKKKHLESNSKATAEAMGQATKLFDGLGDDVYLLVQDLKEL